MTEQEPQTIVALFATLPAATAALDALQAAGLPYTSLALREQRPDDPGLPAQAQQAQQLWAVAASVGGPLHQRAYDLLRDHGPLALGHSHTDARPEATRGSIAWGHYVFETSAPTNPIGESTGTTGVSGVATSGIFASDALAEDRPAQ